MQRLPPLGLGLASPALQSTVGFATHWDSWPLAVIGFSQPGHSAVPTQALSPGSGLQADPQAA